MITSQLPCRIDAASSTARVIPSQQPDLRQPNACRVLLVAVPPDPSQRRRESPQFAAEQRIVELAQAADAEVEAPARQQQPGKQQRHSVTCPFPQVLLPGQAGIIAEAAVKLGKVLADTGEFYNRGGVVVRAMVAPDDFYRGAGRGHGVQRL